MSQDVLDLRSTSRPIQPLRAVRSDPLEHPEGLGFRVVLAIFVAVQDSMGAWAT